MRSVLKMSLVVTALLFVLNKDGSPEVVVPLTEAESIPQFVPPPPLQERRNFIPPAGREEMQRQRNAERSASTEWLKEVTSKYSPDSWYLLMSYDSLPASASAPLLNGGVVTSEKTIGTFEYLRGRTRIDLLVSMETNVHEIAHGYFDRNVFRYLLDNKTDFNAGNANGFIYITPELGCFVSFPLKSMFPSAELAKVIPQDLRTYRYDTYINGTTSTQSDGIIGLLNELYAYYCGSRFCYEMLEPYGEAAGSGAAGLFEWVTHTQSSMSAFYEFDFFISEYLLFMKRNHPSEYGQLRSYTPFRESYSVIRGLYIDLINRYLERIDREMNELNSKDGAEARIKDGWLWVRAGDSHIFSGTPLFSDERKILLPVLESKRFREIREDFQLNENPKSAIRSPQSEITLLLF
jgi:hypothetical protein